MADLSGIELRKEIRKDLTEAQTAVLNGGSLGKYVEVANRNLDKALDFIEMDDTKEKDDTIEELKAKVAELEAKVEALENP
jgi:hypothetical protein